MYLFIHHCDLRIVDNTTLNRLWNENKQVQPIFIFTPEQIVDNSYKSSNAIQFMIDSLIDLEQAYLKNSIKLLYFLGKTEDVLEELVSNHKNKIQGISFNRDYSPFATEREQLVQDLCDRYGIECISTEDKLLNPVELVVTNKGEPYRKFTPYYNKALTFPVNHPQTIKPVKTISSIESNTTLESIDNYYSKNPNILKGGRAEALSVLGNIRKQKDYNNSRNIPSKSTSRLSAYLKFGCISIREVYYKTLEELGDECELIKQYYWRDFYSMLLYYNKSVSDTVSITKESFNNIEWDNNEENYERWCNGETGCPIVDAGMREMNVTGYMHNRVRMIVATFLIFYLKIDWRWGMKYFSKKLTDIDWASNVGNWQWTAGTELWSNDYYKVFSMDSQVKRFDPECTYIKKWIPELKDVDPNDLIHWDREHYQVKGYVEPIITDNKMARKEGIEMYRETKE
jgi:deoxyribodipyrimidine photo-lyase